LEFEKDGIHVVSDKVAMLIDSWRFKSTSKLGKLAAIVNNGDCKKIRANEDNLYSQCEVDALASNLPAFSKDDEVTLNYISQENQTKGKLTKISSLIAKDAIDFYSAKDEYLDYLSSINYAIKDREQSKNVFTRLDKYRILCSNRETELGCVQINSKVFELVKSKCPTQLRAKVSNPIFMPGTVILVTQNDLTLDLKNGDVGVIAFDKDSKLRAFFPTDENEELKSISPERLNEYEYGFAMTIHKSQGSEYQNVTMVSSVRENPVLTKELIYTGLTRAKSVEIDNVTSGGRVRIISDKDVFINSVGKKVQRDSGLAVMLR
jgi:exodeoxyribonuclease V alpha subunit